MTQRPSARLPAPAPIPSPATRTPEQRALLLVGAGALLAALAAGAGLHRLPEGWNPLLLGFPFLFVVAGSGGVLLGLFRLEVARRARSIARGRLAVFGLALILICAPVPASLTLPARTTARAFNCQECGARGHYQGVQNAWGTWIEHGLRLGGQSPTPYGGWSRVRGTCDHGKCLPWLRD